MALTTQKYFNLRQTVAYVTDGANQGCVPEDTGGSFNLKTYPFNVILDGDTHATGWSSGGATDGARNLNAGNDPRLAGSNFTSNSGTQKYFKIDLTSAGDWTINLAIGHDSASSAYSKWEIYDDTTLLETVTKGSGQGAGEYYDAAGTLHTSAANWVSNQAGKLYTFATSTLIIRVGSTTAQSDFTSITTVGIQKSVSGPVITDVDTDESITATQTNVVITGTGFSSATVEIRQGATEVAQSIDSQSATSIQFDVVFDSGSPDLKYGSATIAVINGDTSEDTEAITIAAPTGKNYVTLTSIESVADNRITAAGDLEIGDQLEWSNVVGGAIGDVTINADGTFDCDEAVTSFDVRAWDADDSTWGAIATQSVGDEVVPPVTPTDTVTGGGFYFDFDRALSARKKRRRELEEAEEAAESLQNKVDAEIAQLLHEQQRKDEERANLERIKKLVAQYPKEKFNVERVDKALQHAREKQTQLSYLALQREYERMTDEEDALFIAILALID